MATKPCHFGVTNGGEDLHWLHNPCDIGFPRREGLAWHLGSCWCCGMAALPHSIEGKGHKASPKGAGETRPS